VPFLATEPAPEVLTVQNNSLRYYPGFGIKFSHHVAHTKGLRPLGRETNPLKVPSEWGKGEKEGRSMAKFMP
jgi:hypothetical protein